MNRSRFLIALGVILCLVLAPVIALMPTNIAYADLADSAWPIFRQNPQHTGRSPDSPPAFAVPELKWNFTTGWIVMSSPAIGPDGTIYVGSHDKKLYAINPDGSQRWSFTTGGEITSSPAIAADGTIYVGSYDSRLYALNPNGGQKWSFAAEDPIYSSPAIGADGTIYVGSLDNNFYAINPADGSRNWTFATGDDVFSSPAIGADGTIYVGSSDDKLYAINPDGSPRWSFPTGGDVASSPAIGADGTIYVGSADGRLYAINPDGSQRWSFTITGPTIVTVTSSPAIGADGTIYVGASDWRLYAINPDGTYKWHFTTGMEIHLSSPAIGADGTIYIGSLDGNLYAINPADGSQRWSFPTGGSVFSSPAIGDDGTIYVGSDDFNFYAIGGMYTLTIPCPLGQTVGLPCSDYSVTDPGCGNFTYAAGTVVNLVAEAEEDCCFVEWIGDVGTIDNVNAASTTITMEGNYIVGPRFEECPTPGCFIATAAYGTPMAEEIQILRDFRDEYLLTNPVGQALVDVYYEVSPPIAEFITEHPSLKPIVRAGLLPAVAMSAVAVNTGPAEKMAIVGLLVLVSVAVAIWTKRRRGRNPQYT